MTDTKRTQANIICDLFANELESHIRGIGIVRGYFGTKEERKQFLSEERIFIKKQKELLEELKNHPDSKGKTCSNKN